jgi:uncharacterized protein YegP (UPF0339 family)
MPIQDQHSGAKPSLDLLALLASPATPESWRRVLANNPAAANAAITRAEQSLDAVGSREPAGIDWRQQLSTPHPSVRHGHAMAFDSARGVVVLFGGHNDVGHLSDTWEYDGEQWQQLSPGNRPSSRSDHAMVYDSARQVVVLFGGSDNYVNFSETWEWNGTNWTQRNPANNPWERCQHVMAYDSAREVTVLFGGWSDSNHSRLDDTWEYDGVNWAQRTPVNHPLGRWAAMTYDAARAVVVLFGGDCGSGCFSGETWEWDGGDWVLQTPANHPLARYGHSMAYDSQRALIILFGGYAASGLSLNDTWEYDGANWVQQSPSITPVSRLWHAMAYDAAQGETILFGGFDDVSNMEDTWEYGAPLLRPALSPISNPEGDGDYLIAWSSVADATAYTLEEDNDSSFSSSTVRFEGDQTSFQVLGQGSGDWYYRVKASNAQGDSNWSNIEVAGVKPPAPAMFAIANGDGDGTYITDWGEADGATAYELQEDDNSAFTSPTVRYNGANNQYEVSGQEGGTWYYRVRASNAGGSSLWSNIESVDVLPAAPALQPISNPDSNGDYLVDWNDVTGATSYRLEEDDNPEFHTPNVRYSGDSSHFQVTGQPTGVWYYRVRASNVAGEGPWSNTQSASVTPAAPVLHPINNPDGDGSYLIDWSDVPGATNYWLEEDDNSAFTSPTTLYNGANSQYQVSGQQTGAWYYRARATNAGGDSPWSNTESIIVLPAAPVLFTISNPDRNGDYLVGWSEVAGAETYRLEEDDSTAFTSPAVRYTGVNNYFQVYGQEAGTWHYRVRATNAFGNSPWSSMQSVTVGWRLCLPLVLSGLAPSP